MLDNATVIFGQDDFNTLSFMSNDLVNLVKFKLELSKYFYNLDKDGYINVVNEILSNDEKLILIILFYPQSEAEYQQILSDINYFNNLNQSHIYIMLEELSDFTIGNHSNYGELLITKTNVKTKGDLIGVVDGVIGEYPDNGIQGKYYYEKVK